MLTVLLRPLGRVGAAVVQPGAGVALATALLLLIHAACGGPGANTNAARTDPYPRLPTPDEDPADLDPAGDVSRAIRAVPLDGDGSLSWSFTVVGVPAAERDTLAFQWVFGDASSEIGDSVSHRYAHAGQYVVTVAATDARGATAYALSEVVAATQDESAPAGALVILVEAHVADGNPPVLSGTARATPLEPGETVEYEWLFADGETAAGAQAIHALTGESPYRVSVTGHTSRGRSASRFQYFVLPNEGAELPYVDAYSDVTDSNGLDDADENGPPPGTPRAFPSAQGLGAFARGGRGGDVVYVTTLADYERELPNGQSNPSPIVGSLRWACEVQTGPRTILFKVGGTIALTGRVFLLGEQGSHVTIAGQSAPGDGIQLTGYPLHIGAGAQDIIVRHIRSRPGWTGPEELGVKDAITILSENGLTRNVIIDHCSLEWAMDENGGVGNNTENLTFQWCIFGEGSAFNDVTSGPGLSRGMLVSDGIPSDQFLTIHHCLFVNNGDRNPDLTQNGGMVDFVNNYICSVGIVGTSILPFSTYSPRANFVKNVYFNTTSVRPIVVHTHQGREVDPASFYVEDNLSSFTPTATGDDWNIMRNGDGTQAVSTTKRRFTPWPMPDAYTVAADAPETVVDRVLAGVGANYPAWDVVDQRLILEARDGSGDAGFGPSIADHEQWPVLSNGTPYTDTDGDGISDPWENASGLDPSNAADGLQDDDGDGYTNLEEFLNSLIGE